MVAGFPKSEGSYTTQLQTQIHPMRGREEKKKSKELLNHRKVSVSKYQPACGWQAAQYQGGNLRKAPHSYHSHLYKIAKTPRCPHPLELTSSAPQYVDGNHQCFGDPH